MEPRGLCFYIYNRRLGEFMRRAATKTNPRRCPRVPMGGLCVTWAGATQYAQRFVNPSYARKKAAEINAQLGRKDCEVVDQAIARDIERTRLAREAALRERFGGTP